MPYADEERVERLELSRESREGGGGRLESFKVPLFVLFTSHSLNWMGRSVGPKLPSLQEKKVRLGCED